MGGYYREWPLGWSNRNYRNVAFPHLRSGRLVEMNYDGINAIVARSVRKRSIAPALDCFLEASVENST